MSNQLGWVKIHRSLTEHWIWTKEKHSYQSAWIDLVMMVNHEDRKVSIGNRIMIVKKGQTWTSYRKLRERWGWSRDRFYSFIKMLVDDGMIQVCPQYNGTLITVLNYLNYQGVSDFDQKKPDHKSDRKSDHRPDYESDRKSDTNKKVRMNKNDKENKGGWEK